MPSTAPAEHSGDGPPLIVIGAGLAGWTTVREFRKLDRTTPVVLITADSGDFYAKPSLSNAFAQRRLPGQLVTTPADTMAASLQVSLWAHSRVLSIDPAARTVSTATGTFSYRQLVLATGAQAIRLPLAGDAADQVLSVNSLVDFTRLHAGLTGPGIDRSPGAPAKETRRARQVLIMGAGLIGCEFANDLASAGYQVNVVDPAAGPMAALLPPEAGAALQVALRDLGVGWHFGTTVKAVAQAHHADAEADLPRLRVELSSGESLAADLVLSAIGLRSDTTLARAAGLACERGIVVDRQLQTSAPDIYALGDGAQYASAGDRTLPFVMPIMNAAKVLAPTLAGCGTYLSFPPMPVAIKTPAMPLVVMTPSPAHTTVWQAVEPGVWHARDALGGTHGYVLAGRQTSRRTEQAQLLAV